MTSQPQALLDEIEAQIHLCRQAGEAILAAFAPIDYPDSPPESIRFGEIVSFWQGA